VVQDYDLAAVGSVPRTPIDEQLAGFITDAFTAAGCEVRAGALLPRLFQQAGIGLPDATDVAGRLDRLVDAAPMLEGVVRSLLPAVIGGGLATESDARSSRPLHASVTEDPDRPLLWPRCSARGGKDPERPEGRHDNPAQGNSHAARSERPFHGRPGAARATWSSSIG
jgi:hypothetical protein